MNFAGSAVYVPPNAMATLRRSASASSRKRSVPSLDPARHSFASRKSESDRDLLGTFVPVGVVFMEQVAMDLTVAKDALAEVRYVLSVRHLKSNASWSFSRSFDEYRRFQQRLLKALDHGHFCSAECPWLYTFLKSYFPKKHLFQFATSRVVANRKDGLQRFFVSLQSFLLNRANYNCTIVATAVIDEVIAFVYGDYAKYYQLGGDADSAGGDNQRHSFVTKASSLSLNPEDDDTSTVSGSSSCSPGLFCQLCDSSLEGEAYASRQGSLSTISFVRASSSSLVDEEQLPMSMLSESAPASCSAINASGPSSRRGPHYVMRLGCGHQFHDECIVPILNSTLRCPTCQHLEVK
jgi:hypothetical protein